MNNNNKYDESVYDEPQCEEVYSDDDAYGVVRLQDQETESFNEWGKW